MTCSQMKSRLQEITCVFCLIFFCYITVYVNGEHLRSHSTARTSWAVTLLRFITRPSALTEKANI